MQEEIFCWLALPLHLPLSYKPASSVGMRSAVVGGTPAPHRGAWGACVRLAGLVLGCIMTRYCTPACSQRGNTMQSSRPGGESGVLR